MDHQAVTDAIISIAEATIRPRFRHLDAAEIEHKDDGELVTIADRECEAALRVALQRIVDAPVLGEEGADASADERDLLTTSDQLWIVDPLDGTANFARGSVDHAVMVAFVDRGVTTASWMWAPEHEVLAVAHRGEGAWVNQQPVVAEPPPGPMTTWAGIVKGRGAPDDVVATVLENLHHLGATKPGWGCAGVEYPKVVCGAADFVTYWRTLPWDHAPGVLFAEEAGLVAVRPDATPYTVADGIDGLIVAHPTTVEQIRTVLFGR